MLAGGVGVLSMGLLLGQPQAVTPQALTAMHTATLIHAKEELGLDAFVTGTGRCPETAKFCFGLAVHVVVVEGEPVQSPEHFAAHVAFANELFANIGVGFEAVSVQAEDGDKVDVETRSDRDALGKDGFSRGVVHVYLVGKLADVDIEGEVIRGVHWRFRPDTAKRWIILSSIASPLVLCHEMGHFFGLPHSHYKVSLMNKKPAPGRPPWPERVFAKPELQKMKRDRDAMVADGMLVDRK
jgi:hypothetical protein